MNKSGNIKLTKLLGPSLSPRCALINETCEKENNDTAGKTKILGLMFHRKLE